MYNNRITDTNKKSLLLQSAEQLVDPLVLWVDTNFMVVPPGDAVEKKRDYFL